MTMKRTEPPPTPPEAPSPEECCQNGCDPCIFDRYAEAMREYREELAAWQARTQAGANPKRTASAIRKSTR